MIFLGEIFRRDIDGLEDMYILFCDDFLVVFIVFR